jgi:hypothetical protein
MRICQAWVLAVGAAWLEEKGDYGAAAREVGATPEVGGVDPATLEGEEGVLRGGLERFATDGQVDLGGVEMDQHVGDGEQAGGAGSLVVGQHQVAHANRATRAQAVGYIGSGSLYPALGKSMILVTALSPRHDLTPI